MFTFNFAAQHFTEGGGENKNDEKNDKLTWLPAKKIEIPEKYLKKVCEPIDYNVNTKVPGFLLNLVDQDTVVIKLKEENCENIIEAESQHSDLLPAKYEGGLKVWECTYDLTDYLIIEDFPLRDKNVLDLGCGAGIIGLITFLRGAKVHFQDYNAEVIESVTIPNVILNCEDHESIKEKCEFYCGDWESFTRLNCNDDESEKYDYIFTSETIYNPDNHVKLYNVLKRKLKKTGICFIAGKTYYFGVGGGMRQFEKLVERDNIFDVKVVWKSTEGLQRELLKLERKT